MMRKKLRLPCAALVLICLSLGPVARAQFSADSQTNVISGTVVSWPGNYVVGYSTRLDFLRVENGGQLFDVYGQIGYWTGGDNNAAVVRGTGSLWSNTADVVVGGIGMGNSLVISNGGEVFGTQNGLVGDQASSSNNWVLATDAATTWACGGTAFVGKNGAGNSVIVSNGASAACSVAFVGYNLGADRNSISVTGTGSIWRVANGLTIGDQGSSNRLVISSGAMVLGGCCGLVASMDGPTFNNTALVTGSGSVWSNGSLDVGWWGAGNSLVVSNGGAVMNSGDGFLGINAGENSNNTVTVVGSGSRWQNGGGVYVYGSGNQLTIGSGGSVIATAVTMFSVWPSAGSSINVLGGSLIVSNGSLTIPQTGFGTVTISNGMVQAQNVILANYTSGTEGTLTMAGGSLLVQSAMVIGYGGCSTTGTVVLTGGTCAVTNATDSAVLEVRSGTLTQTGGTLLIDKLVITNACGRFVHAGGILSVGTLILDPSLDADGDGLPNGWEQAYGFDPLTPHANVDTDGDGLTDLQEYLAGTDPTNTASAFKVTALAREGNNMRVTWMTGIGRTNALQATTSGPGGRFDTNMFASIFIVTNTVSSTTNYVDVGGATNTPARLYRVRLVP